MSLTQFVDTASLNSTSDGLSSNFKSFREGFSKGMELSFSRGGSILVYSSAWPWSHYLPSSSSQMEHACTIMPGACYNRLLWKCNIHIWVNIVNNKYAVQLKRKLGCFHFVFLHQKYCKYLRRQTCLSSCKRHIKCTFIKTSCGTDKYVKMCIPILK